MITLGVRMSSKLQAPTFLACLAFELVAIYVHEVKAAPCYYGRWGGYLHGASFMLWLWRLASLL